MFRSDRVWAPVGPGPVLFLEHGGILGRQVLYESLFDENGASAQEIGETCARWRPTAGQNSRFSVFVRDLGAHEAELDPLITFSTTHRRTRDPDHSTDQSL